jgi:pseudaminic acid cytidylyltransferase
MVCQKKIICLICCRGGSKTIKNKNIKSFCNKPLLFWCLQNLKKSNIFDRIILSTDSIKIANFAKKFKIEIPGLRPKALAKATSNQFDTHKYIFRKLGINDKNSIVCVFNNNPFINANIIKKSFQLFKKAKFKGLLVDACKVDGDYISYKQFVLKKGKQKYINPKKYLNLALNRQSLKQFYTNIYNIRWGAPSLLESFQKFKHKIIYGKNSFILLKKIENFELDDIEDWIISETIFRHKILNK